MKSRARNSYIHCIPAHVKPPQTHVPSQLGSSPPGEPASQSACEGMVSLRELSYLPRSEFKVQGDQVQDQLQECLQAN